MPRLTNKQREFINQYFLCNMNGTEAVIQAGYQCKNRQTAAAIASENLRKTHVREAIEKRLEENTISANQVLHILSVQALGDIRYVMSGEEPSIRTALENNATATIKKWKKRRVVTEKTTITEVEIELHDPQAAAVQLGRYYKLFTDKIVVDDWRMDAVLSIRRGELEFVDLAEELGHDLATELFQQAGVPVVAEG